MSPRGLGAPSPPAPDVANEPLWFVPAPVVAYVTNAARGLRLAPIGAHAVAERAGVFEPTGAGPGGQLSAFSNRRALADHHAADRRHSGPFKANSMIRKLIKVAREKN